MTFHLLFDFCGVPLQGYLYKKTCGTQNSPHAFAQDGRDLFKRGIVCPENKKAPKGQKDLWTLCNTETKTALGCRRYYVSIL